MVGIVLLKGEQGNIRVRANFMVTSVSKYLKFEGNPLRNGRILPKFSVV